MRWDYAFFWAVGALSVEVGGPLTGWGEPSDIITTALTLGIMFVPLAWFLGKILPN